ncbi:MAG: hypothetical protein AAF585_18550, partial [Verrucomicrobiota bacterium]
LVSACREGAEVSRDSETRPTAELRAFAPSPPESPKLKKERPSAAAPTPGSESRPIAFVTDQLRTPIPLDSPDEERSAAAEKSAEFEVAANRYVPEFASNAPVSNEPPSAEVPDSDSFDLSALPNLNETPEIRSVADLEKYLGEFRTRVDELKIESFSETDAAQIRDELIGSVHAFATRISNELDQAPADAAAAELREELARLMEKPSI